MTEENRSHTTVNLDHQITETKVQIIQFTTALEKAKQNVQSCIDRNSSLSLSAAQERAQTQSMGRGIGGVFLGSKYIAARRKEAAYYNAAIARNIAAQRAEIQQQKKMCQETVRKVQDRIIALKDKLKHLQSQKKDFNCKKKTSSQLLQNSNKSVALLEKLQEAYQIGLLTQEEYEEKRKKIVEQI